MSEYDSTVINNITDIPEHLSDKSKRSQTELLRKVEEENKVYYIDECKKLDEWSEDLKENLQRELKDLDREIKDKTREANAMAGTSTLAEMITAKDEVNSLKKLRDKKRRHLFEEEDRIAEENERLQEEMRKKLIGKTETKHIFTIKFEIK